MVLKISKWALIIYAFCLESWAVQQKLILNWTGDRSAICQKRIEAFLTELRSVAPDHRLEFEMGSEKQPSDDSNMRRLQMRCLDDYSEGRIEISNGTATKTLRYQNKAQGFDSLDWLTFQQEFLRAEAPVKLTQLAPQEARAPTSSTPFENLEAETKPSLPVYKTWWFWSALTGVAATSALAIYGAVSHPKPGGKVEIR